MTRIEQAGICGGCGGPHRFDTSVPSVEWNAVIRANNMSEYLCTTCIVEAFARAGRSFTGQLWGEGFNGLAIEIRISSQEAESSRLVQEQNNDLRATLSGILDETRQALERVTLAPDLPGQGSEVSSAR